MVCTAWEVEAKAKESGEIIKGLSNEQKVLKKKIDNTGMGGLSFFAWFGFIGRRVSAEENAAATALEFSKRAARMSGKKLVQEDDEDEEEDDEDDVDMSLEIFADGDELAIAIAEDLWPGAIKYFSELLSILGIFSSGRGLTLEQHKHKNKMPFQMQISNLMTKKRSKAMNLITKVRARQHPRPRNKRARKRSQASLLTKSTISRQDRRRRKKVKIILWKWIVG